MLRRAEEKDIDRIMELLRQVHRVHSSGRPDLFTPGGIKYKESEVRDIINDEDTPVYVSTDENDVVLAYLFGAYGRVSKDNTCLVEHKSFYIDDLCVDEAVRGRHIGEGLYNYVLEEVKKAGCYNVTLHVWNCNPSAMKFYEKMGLTPQYISLEKIL
ncbi:MAG: GNAT family N-acetyltransferase [Lachnospiraceae bacterium]|nr:GNAT family N-acetyltransferase [Lachnospiraceae bacterium]MBQ2406701.1 GNAT family N-acetyltransferase [Lachnospiraceae bacterium]MEE0920107.1 GNAT family N-acetyltransferase [Lachnospiraceae bacterium]